MLYIGFHNKTNHIGNPKLNSIINMESINKKIPPQVYGQLLHEPKPDEEEFIIINDIEMI